MSMKPDLQPGTVRRLRPAARANRVTASSAWQPDYTASTEQRAVTQRPRKVLIFLMARVEIIWRDLSVSVSQEPERQTSHCRR